MFAHHPRNDLTKRAFHQTDRSVTVKHRWFSWMVNTMLAASNSIRSISRGSTVRPKTSTQYDVVDLTPVQDDALSPQALLTPKAIDAAGRVLGNRSLSDGTFEPFYSHEAGAISRLGFEPSARVVALGDRGAIVGRTVINGRSRACSWHTESIALLPIPDALAEDVVDVFTGAASIDGQVAGWMTMTDGGAVPLHWVDGDVSVFPAAGTLTHGYPASILDDGSIAGEARAADGGHYPICWRNGAATLLRTPRHYGRVLAGSAQSGVHLGSAWDGERFVAAFWRNDTVTLLPSISTTYCESAAFSMNHDGVAVGVIYREVARNHWIACRWQGERVDALDDLIDSDLGIRLMSANGINGAGQIAVAAIWPDGSLHAVRLDPR